MLEEKVGGLDAYTLPALGARSARVGRGTGALADSAGALFALRVMERFG